MSPILASGTAVMSSLGTNINDTWSGLLTKKHGTEKVKTFSIDKHKNQNACEVKGLSLVCFDDVLKLGRASSMLITSIDDALHDAGIDIQDIERCGICIGTTMGELDGLDKDSATNRYGPQVLSENVKNYYNLTGPSWTITNACAAGNFSIAKAVDELESGRADVMIAAGVDALSWVAFTGFSSLRAMSPDLCRPFDENRKGLILGEGAGVVILETMEHLLKRSGKAKASILGYGMNCDAHHITQPDPAAAGAISAMKAALEKANMKPSDIGYVSAHGTGTPANDLMEGNALYELFGKSVKTSSIKGNIGHTLGAASVIEAAICIKALEEKLLPPTANVKSLDPRINVDVLWDKPESFKSMFVMSNAYAFGGINSSIIIGKAF
ncbi:beta-ketoacyl-[acyl-carrier-protein] synthase family protein [Bacillus sp. SM2101]|uniref:beta-ketoacyl-[acyl-carrier-protein] synthase family protein n=1 Tax=Bacillus sp. SM2101 TaxID=2805366 RepID=UPI001BDF27B5|nr:beta-ketoacyl-[acyl-carrier-protein] synthase family protein [Bacillus sp. SM2101]